MENISLRKQIMSDTRLAIKTIRIDLIKKEMFKLTLCIPEDEVEARENFHREMELRKQLNLLMIERIQLKYA